DGTTKVIGVLHDVTERKQTDEELKALTESLEQRVDEQTAQLAESEELFRNMSAAAQDAIITADSEECISYWNEAAERMFGYSKEETIGKNVHELTAPKRYRERHSEVYKEFQGAGPGSAVGKTLELAAIRKDGTEFPIELSLSGTKIKGKWNAIGIIRDITGRKQAEDTIRHMAYHDVLTRLPNRMLFVDHLTLELAHARRDKRLLSVMFLDLDEFKVVNDTLGHTMGDRLLKDIGGRLVNCIRESDTVARMGGDEFTLLLPRISHVENVVNIAGKVLGEVKQPVILDGNRLNITTSIGIALYPADGEDAETLLKNADAAMYKAKEQGRNNFQFFSPS
ncbi:MAG: diguanylate cyclase, partial [Candidatus Brocadiales bacterium]